MATVAVQPVGLRPQSLTEIAFDRIRDAITSKALAPGTRVSESMLGEMLQVSKTPVREALLRLCHVGLVEPTTRGLRVVMPDHDVVRDAYELRLSLEANAARTAAERADSTQREAILHAATMSLGLADEQDADGFDRWDAGFHTSVAESTGNRLVAKAVTDSMMLTLTLRPSGIPAPADCVHCGKQHVEVAKAIASGEGDLASRLMADHISTVMAFAMAATDSKSAGPNPS